LKEFKKEPGHTKVHELHIHPKGDGV